MKVVTAVVNNPIFIEIQYETLKKYMLCEYEFIVFNDAKSWPDYSNFKNPKLKQEINDLCTKLNIKCIEIPNENHKKESSACVRCADSMNFILDYQRKYPDQYLLLDSDMFLINYFDSSIYNICGVVLQSRPNIEYIWNGLAYFNIPKMSNISLLNWNTCALCDVGGSMKDWLKTQDYKRIYFIPHLCSNDWDSNHLPKEFLYLKDFFENDPRNEKGKYFCELYDNKFLHYRAGGNWMNQSYSTHVNLSNKLKTLLLTNSTIQTCNHIFVSYGDDNFANSRERIKKEAITFGFNVVKIFEPKDLSPDFKQKTNVVLNMPKSCWIWKAFVFKKTLDDANPNDVVCICRCRMYYTSKHTFSLQ
jgi:hypothetical protein